MRVLMVSPKTPPAPLWWQGLTEILGFSERQSKIFWSALSASKDPRLKALVFRCHQHEEHLRSQRLNLLHDGTVLLSFLRQTWTPHRMCLALETLNREGLLSRPQCKPLEDRFLARCDKFGGWTMAPKGT